MHGSAHSIAGIPALQRCDGAAEIGFARRGDVSALAHLYQRAPCRVLFPDVAAGAPPEAVLVTTSGGLAGGDRLRFSVAAGPGAGATVTTQAAEKVYRSLGPDTRVDIAIDVGADATLEWLPQETILFDEARLDRRVVCQIAPRGRLLAVEALIFGRSARGERFRRGRLLDSWRLKRAGRLIWADALSLDGDVEAMLNAPAGLGGAVAIATVLYVAEDAGNHLELVRDLLASATCRGGASLVAGVLLARLIGMDAAALRGTLIELLCGLRAMALGQAAAMPRVWNS